MFVPANNEPPAILFIFMIFGSNFSVITARPRPASDLSSTARFRFSPTRISWFSDPRPSDTIVAASLSGAVIAGLSFLETRFWAMGFRDGFSAALLAADETGVTWFARVFNADGRSVGRCT